MKKAIFSGMIAISSLAMFAGQTNVSANAKYKPVPKVSVTYRMVDSRTGAVLRTQKSHIQQKMLRRLRATRQFMGTIHRVQQISKWRIHKLKRSVTHLNNLRLRTVL